MTEPTKNTSPSKKLSIYRAICAALVFNVYSLFLCSAFQKNTPYLFEQHRSDGFPAPHIDLASASWGKHYLWRLIAAVVVTIFVGLLAGAFARIRGKRIAALSNIPSVLFWCWLLYVLWSGKYEIDEQFAF